MPWKKEPILIHLEGAPFLLRLSSLYHFRVFTLLLLLCAALFGWGLGSGLEVLMQSFEPSEQLSAQKRLLDYKTMSVHPELNQTLLNSNTNIETTTEDLRPPGKSSSE